MESTCSSCRGQNKLHTIMHRENRFLGSLDVCRGHHMGPLNVSNLVSASTVGFWPTLTHQIRLGSVAIAPQGVCPGMRNLAHHGVLVVFSSNAKGILLRHLVLILELFCLFFLQRDSVVCVRPRAYGIRCRGIRASSDDAFVASCNSLMAYGGVMVVWCA